MSKSLNEELVKKVLEECEGRGLAIIWDYSQFETTQTFNERCEAFFWILSKILESGEVKLMNKGKFLEGDSKELVQLFRCVFPKADIPNTTDDMRFWFYGDPPDPCPAIAVWRYVQPDGTIVWMPCP
jgi:hypothetical protein